MGEPIITKRRFVAAKIEAVEGTPEALTAAETGLLATDVKWTPDIKMLPRNAALPTFSKLLDIPGIKLARMTFKAEVMGRAAAFAAGNLPWLDPYFRACGLARTLDVTPSTEKVTYKRASINLPTITIGLYDGKTIRRVAGARGSVNLSGSNGEPVMAEFDFIGVYLDPADGVLASPSFGNLVPPRLIDANFKIGAYEPVMKSWNINLSNKLAPRENCNSLSGYQSFMIVDGDTRGKFDPEYTDIAEHDWYGRWKAGTPGALSIGAFGEAQYNRVKVDCPQIAYSKIDSGEREGIETANTDFQCGMVTGDDEIVIEFS